MAKAAKDFFPNFEIARINNHLRLTKNVSEEVQRLALHPNPDVPNNVLMSNSTLPSNVAEGHPLVTIQGQDFLTTLKECLSLSEGLKTMIVVDTKLVGKDLLKKYMESFGKKAIFLTDEREYRSTEGEICQWVCEQTDYILVTNLAYIKGFECEAIIDFTSIQGAEVISRATIRVIKVPGTTEII